MAKKDFRSINQIYGGFFLPGSGVTLIFSSDCIKQHAEELKQRPQIDENVNTECIHFLRLPNPYRMEPTV